MAELWGAWLLDLQWDVRVQHILREVNRGADAMTNFRFQLALRCHRFDRAPYDVHEIVVQDDIGVSFPRMCL